MAVASARSSFFEDSGGTARVLVTLDGARVWQSGCVTETREQYAGRHVPRHSLSLVGVLEALSKRRCITFSHNCRDKSSHT